MGRTKPIEPERAFAPISDVAQVQPAVSRISNLQPVLESEKPMNIFEITETRPVLILSKIAKLKVFEHPSGVGVLESGRSRPFALALRRKANKSE
jgi:hypothetical protein